MNPIFNDLQPQEVWQYFSEIIAIPRPSKKEDKIVKYLLAFAKKQGLKSLHDKIGNVLILKPATKGMEKRAPICLQAHTDMVCEKNANKVFNFDKDAIEPMLEKGWIKANGTTLGADDGIGVATILAILASTDIPHGPLECLFTVDEETGLGGAFALQENWLKSKMLLNLDSEDEGEIFIGCAGGVDTIVEIDYARQALPTSLSANGKAFRIDVSGLNGGHSGDDINKGLGCAIKILTRFLWNINQQYQLAISHFEGGNLRNAIAREAHAIIVIQKQWEPNFMEQFATFRENICYEYRNTEKSLDITLKEAKVPENAMLTKFQRNLLNVLYACPHGVLAMSQEVPDFVETSTNLASIKMDERKIVITTSQRSSLESAKQAAAEIVEATFDLIGAEITHSEGYPGWTPNPNSLILGIAKSSYKNLFKKEPQIKAIHAGLECGIIGKKYPEMDMISFGPTLRGVHSPNEKINIQSVEKFWDFTLEILKNVPAN